MPQLSDDSFAVDAPVLRIEEMERLIAERSPYYQFADLAVASRDVPHEKIVDECIDALFAHLLPGGVSHPSGT